jgi:hypothetical protein
MERFENDACIAIAQGWVRAGALGVVGGSLRTSISRGNGTQSIFFLPVDGGESPNYRELISRIRPVNIVSNGG